MTRWPTTFESQVCTTPRTPSDGDGDQAEHEDREPVVVLRQGDVEDVAHEEGGDDPEQGRQEDEPEHGREPPRYGLNRMATRRRLPAARPDRPAAQAVGRAKTSSCCRFRLCAMASSPFTVPIGRCATGP